jgi:hypothetical protein
MVGIIELWLPILLSAVIVFVVSSIIHTVTPWHKSDYPKLPNEDKVMDALRPLAIPPGDYLMPCPSSSKELRSPEFLEKRKKGPVVVMTVMSSGPVSMGKNLLQWFLYCPCRNLCCIRHGTCTASRCRVPAGLPVRRDNCIRQLRPWAMADVDLVPALMVDDLKGDRRWTDLRPSHSGDVWVALAAVGIARD